MRWNNRNIHPLLALLAILLLLCAGLYKLAQWMDEPVPERLEEFIETIEDPDRVKYIIVHHSVSDWGDGVAVVQWHTGPPPHKGWDRPGYHAVIGNGFPTNVSLKKHAYSEAADGKIDRIVSEDLRVNGVRYGNRNALQVCLIGNLDKSDPTEKQMRALIGLLAEWSVKYQLDPRKAIYGHGEMQRKIGREDYSKTCPGTHVDMDAVRRAVNIAVLEQVTSEARKSY